MTTPDNERERLGRLYAEMGADEIERIAASAPDLTEVARQVLQQEIASRGITFNSIPASDAPPETPDSSVEEEDGLVTIRQFRDLHEALLAQGTLQSAEIDCLIADDNMVRLDWFISNLLGGVKLRVRAEDVDAVREILEQEIPENFDAGEGGVYEQPHCPNCRSLDISFQEFNKGVGLVSAYVVGIPVQIGSNKWKCNSCNREWQEDLQDQTL